MHVELERIPEQLAAYIRRLTEKRQVEPEAHERHSRLVQKCLGRGREGDRLLAEAVRLVQGDALAVSKLLDMIHWHAENLPYQVHDANGVLRTGWAILFGIPVVAAPGTTWEQGSISLPTEIAAGLGNHFFCLLGQAEADIIVSSKILHLSQTNMPPSWRRALLDSMVASDSASVDDLLAAAALEHVSPPHIGGILSGLLFVLSEEPNPFPLLEGGVATQWRQEAVRLLRSADVPCADAGPPLQYHHACVSLQSLSHLLAEGSESAVTLH